MQMRWRRPSARMRQRSLSEEVRSALTREVLKTELLRAKVLLATVTALIATLMIGYWLAPQAIEKIWRGQFSLAPLALSYAPLVVLELSVIALLRRRLTREHNALHWGRYIGVLIETSLPTVGLYLQMNAMGPGQALAFAVPFAYFVFIILSTLWLDFWLSVLTGFVAAAELLAIAMLYQPPGFESEPAPDFAFHLLRSLVILTCGVLAGGVGAQLRRQFEASIGAAEARDRITGLFGQHVSPQVVEQLLAAGAEGAGETRRVVVMFVDFRDFTAAARARSPNEVVTRLDDAFAVLVDILEQHGGIVNKFLGDGFLALFGAPIEDPDAAARAVAAGREMLAGMEESNVGHPWPLRIGISIHIGDVVVGTVGSPRRKEYTVIGDTVNFAARLESLNKQFGTQLLISSAIRKELGASADDAALLGSVPMRGYAEPMEVWRLG
ncbi:adenylate/guanylate cyclase domain-containing protein [Rhodopseudomonas sp. HC1]|uniref:adenylate/guanylate cyclase domain-containing protein n=1 Tax=Rhodopseudomonas infernalis TaxID=2897386 RepID=UPI001EE791BA|nr:adenylate/guanylate cyclase domain-containing protein [Rhodopseudomonas infernalis]MCG6207200.1 adenylate/guanylate cyclase domain-containing protein [Rhodopseudomonas infernalis]